MLPRFPDASLTSSWQFPHHKHFLSSLNILSIDLVLLPSPIVLSALTNLLD